MRLNWKWSYFDNFMEVVWVMDACVYISFRVNLKLMSSSFSIMIMTIFVPFSLKKERRERKRGQLFCWRSWSMKSVPMSAGYILLPMRILFFFFLISDVHLIASCCWTCLLSIWLFFGDLFTNYILFCNVIKGLTCHIYCVNGLITLIPFSFGVLEVAI